MLTLITRATSGEAILLHRKQEPVASPSDCVATMHVRRDVRAETFRVY